MTAKLTLVCLVAVAAAYPATAAERVSTTVYIGDHFEVRDHDQPVKYVFDGETRLARVTGSLSRKEQLQRFRLRSGWNLIAPAIHVTDFRAQLERSAPSPGGLAEAVFLLRAQTGEYVSLSAGQPVSAGSVVWVRARTNAVVALLGEPRDAATENVLVPAGGGYVSSPRLVDWRPELPSGVSVWHRAAGSGRWWVEYSGELAPLSEGPPGLAPGEAVFVQTDQALELTPPPASQRILYYHADHLNSAVALTDAQGQLSVERAYHPFGAQRGQSPPRSLAGEYGFAQKEQDEETGLLAVGHRFLHTGLGRWISPDPLHERGGGRNPYAYVNHNPLRNTDPEGAEIRVSRSIAKDGTYEYTIHLKAVFLDATQKKFDQAQVAQFAAAVESTIESSFKGEATGRFDKLKGKFRWHTEVEMRVVDDWRKTAKDEHVFRIVERLPGSRGDARVGHMLGNLNVKMFQPGSDSPPHETAGHEFGHMAGLDHFNHDGNIMREGSSRSVGSVKTDFDQFKTIIRAYDAKQLNQRDQTLLDLDAYAKRDQAKANENP